MKSSIAFFDFDGTITFKDTLFEIIKYQKGRCALYAGLVKISPWLVAMKLKIISNTAAKQKMLSYFFSNTPLHIFQTGCENFISEKLPLLIRHSALKKIKEYQQKGTHVVIVSASAENWIAGWCTDLNIACIATKLEVKNSKITGKIEGRNCHGEEKVRRIKEAYDLDAYDEIFCYGDTKGDKPMLSLATFAYYKPFRQKL